MRPGTPIAVVENGEVRHHAILRRYDEPDPLAGDRVGVSWEPLDRIENTGWTSALLGSWEDGDRSVRPLSRNELREAIAGATVSTRLTKLPERHRRACQYGVRTVIGGDIFNQGVPLGVLRKCRDGWEFRSTWWWTSPSWDTQGLAKAALAKIVVREWPTVLTDYLTEKLWEG